MLYCYRCRRLIPPTSERWIKEKGRSEHEVVCLDCLNLPFCQTENCTNPKKSGSCKKCGANASSYCAHHSDSSYHLRLLTAICNCVKETRKQAQNCEKFHYQYDSQNVCQSCFDSRCMTGVNCGIKKSLCGKCNISLESCWRHSNHIITEHDGYERPVCQNCFMKFQCCQCGLHREGRSCKFCEKMFCYECQPTKLKRVNACSRKGMCHFECTNSCSEGPANVVVK